jgi:hypothetical protein
MPAQGRADRRGSPRSVATWGLGNHRHAVAAGCVPSLLSVMNGAEIDVPFPLCAALSFSLCWHGEMHNRLFCGQLGWDAYR